MENKTFFRKAQTGDLHFKDIFSDVNKKHTSKDTAQMFIAGTPMTTPDERDMLVSWNKPFVFARFFLWGAAALAILYFLYRCFKSAYSLYALLSLMPCLVPIACLLLVWELHIPRNISLYEVLQMVIVGGALSLLFTFIFGVFRQSLLGISGAIWAGLTEEPAKLLAVCIFLRKKDRKYLLNGLLIGFAVGVGFDFMESIGYTFEALVNGIVKVILTEIILKSLLIV